MRATRIIYVENDPVLRGVISEIIGARKEMDITYSCESSDQVLALHDVEIFDAALIDLDLGPQSLNGIEIGLILKEKNPDIGIVIFTQHVVPDFMDNLPDRYNMGWSFIEKRGDISMDYLADVIKSTARGLNIVDPSVQRTRTDVGANPLKQLSGRQREILALAATGLDAPVNCDRAPPCCRHGETRLVTGLSSVDSKSETRNGPAHECGTDLFETFTHLL